MRKFIAIYREFITDKSVNIFHMKVVVEHPRKCSSNIRMKIGTHIFILHWVIPVVKPEKVMDILPCIFEADGENWKGSLADMKTFIQMAKKGYRDTSKPKKQISDLLQDGETVSIVERSKVGHYCCYRKMIQEHGDMKYLSIKEFLDGAPAQELCVYKNAGWMPVMDLEPESFVYPCSIAPSFGTPSFGTPPFGTPPFGSKKVDKSN